MQNNQVKRIKEVVLKGIFCLTIFLSYYFLNHFFKISIPCVIYETTGYYCPGCGITRCLFAILELDFKKAFSYNQLVFISLPFFAIYTIYKTYIYIYEKKDLTKKIPKAIPIILLIITIAFGIIRNLPYFSFLRP